MLHAEKDSRCGGDIFCADDRCNGVCFVAWEMTVSVMSENMRSHSSPRLQRINKIRALA